MESQALLLLPFTHTPSALQLTLSRRRTLTPSLLSPRIRRPSLLKLTPASSLSHHNSSGHHHHGHHHHGHGHGHGHGHSHVGEMNGAQEGVLRFAKASGWAYLADVLREHLQLCCCSMGLLLLAAASPCVLPAPAATTLQNLLIALAFPLVGVIFFHL